MIVVVFNGCPSPEEKRGKLERGEGRCGNPSVWRSWRRRGTTSARFFKRRAPSSSLRYPSNSRFEFRASFFFLGPPLISPPAWSWLLRIVINSGIPWWYHFLRVDFCCAIAVPEWMLLYRIMLRDCCARRMNLSPC